MVVEQSKQDQRQPLIDLHPWPYLRDWGTQQLANGFLNTSNTCFLASTIQCLQHQPLWKNYLLKQHSRECRVKSKICFVCKLKKLAELCFNGNYAVSPKEIAENIDQICSNMKEGLQEDAHEFLTCLFDKIQKNLTVRFEKLDPASEMTTALAKIFGGYLRSRIVCLECFDISNNYEEFFNISLEIDQAESVNEAFHRFTTSENFNNSSWFQCEKCQRKCRADKRYTLNTLPEVLIIHLKRYSYANDALTKVQKFISFDETLNLAPFISEHLATNEAEYQLSSLVVHKGTRLTSGHYYSYVKHPNTREDWFLMDDSNVSGIDWETVSKEQAYILFYSKHNAERIEHFDMEPFIPEVSHQNNSLECRTSFIGKILTRNSSFLKMVTKFMPYSLSKRVRDHVFPVTNHRELPSDQCSEMPINENSIKKNEPYQCDNNHGINHIGGFGFLGFEYMGISFSKGNTFETR